MTSWPTWSVNQESVTETMPSCHLWQKRKPPWSFFPWMGSSAWTISSPGILLGSTRYQPIQKMKVRGPGENKNIPVYVYIHLPDILEWWLFICLWKTKYSLTKRYFVASGKKKRTIFSVCLWGSGQSRPTFKANRRDEIMSVFLPRGEVFMGPAETEIWNSLCWLFILVH